MCGLCGAVAISGELDPAVRRAVRPMNDAIAHRGPDADGFFQDERAALGHRRLSIIDLAAGQQPMCNEDGSVWIVFNGEVYNHASLRTDLEARGHVFRTRCDTEAIVHAYEEYGTECVERLEGMFAFAIWDKRTGELFLARDRLGKKPLFYADLGGALHFASEIKALRQSPAWDGTLDLQSLEGYLSLAYFIAPATIYRHVRKLEPGHWLAMRDGRITVRKYWDVEDFDSDDRPVPELLEELDALLRRAVGERLESEVPLGAFLSGGIDSGLIVSMMSQQMEQRPHTLSVGFGNKNDDELEAAERMARHVGSDHHAAVLTPDLAEVLDPVVGGFDEPFADDSAIPTYYLCQMARKELTVCLSGDGGDESFGGYDFRYVPHAWEQRVRRLLPGSISRRLVGRLGERWPRSPSLPRALRLGTVLENLGEDAEGAYYNDLTYMKPQDARRLMGMAGSRDPRQSPVYAAVTDPYRRCASKSVVQRAQYADLKIYLPNDVLVKVDRMSMIHSLEVRCPLLDRRVVEFAFRIPTSRKMPRLKAKHLLKSLARKHIPPENFDLKKHGFTAPVSEWLAGPFADQFAGDVFSKDSTVSDVLDLDVARKWFDEHRSGVRSRSRALWVVWVLERWTRLACADSLQPVSEA